MTSTATLIAEAKAALAAAAAADERETDSRQLASEARWTAAERMAELAKTMTYRDIAAAVGVSDTTVTRYVKCVYVVEKAASVRKQLFSDVLKGIRGGWDNEPRSVEGKAKVVAEYVKNPDVFADPAVIAAVSTAQRNHSASKLPPKPVHAKPAPAGLLAAQAHQRADYWTKLAWQLDACTKALDAAVTEMRRSGLPDRGGGELIRQLRRLTAAAGKAETVLTQTGIGEATG